MESVSYGKIIENTGNRDWFQTKLHFLMHTTMQSVINRTPTDYRRIIKPRKL